MLIPSIDLQGGRIVQLVQGETLAIASDDIDAWIEKFKAFPRVQLIDLDAAMARGNNAALVRRIAGALPCRVGGGVRTVGRAEELIAAGAEAVIAGSALFHGPAVWNAGPSSRGDGTASESARASSQGAGAFSRIAGAFSRMVGASSPSDEAASRSASASAPASPPASQIVNHDFARALADTIGPTRVICAVDARGGRVVIHGWKTALPLSPVAAVHELEAYCEEFLYTHVDKEGLMQGTDMDAIRSVREATARRLTAAGGITTREEVEALAAMKVDAVVGMAIYTGRLAVDQG